MNYGLESLSMLQLLVYTTFVLGMVAMAAGAWFFFLERDAVAPKFRIGMTVSSTILFIAAINYLYMIGLYGSAVFDQEVQGFPTAYRYIDWILTTPLMLIKFPILLGVGRKGRPFLVKLVILDILMIVFGFFGEILIDTPVFHYGFFGLGCLFYVQIAYLLFNANRRLPGHISDAVRDAVGIMTKFVLIGWLIYPIGYLVPTLGIPADVRELVYNVGDIINKVGLAIILYAAAIRESREESEEA